jgi:hypothetical protein
MMTLLLRYLFNRQYFTQEILLDWYTNGAFYGYAGFQKAKLCAKSFIDQLNNDN